MQKDPNQFQVFWASEAEENELIFNLEDPEDFGNDVLSTQIESRGQEVSDAKQISSTAQENGGAPQTRQNHRRAGETL